MKELTKVEKEWLEWLEIVKHLVEDALRQSVKNVLSAGCSCLNSQDNPSKATINYPYFDGLYMFIVPSIPNLGRVSSPEANLS